MEIGAIGPENGNGSDHDLRFEAATPQLTDLIGESGCLVCPIFVAMQSHLEQDTTQATCAATVARVLIDYTRDEVRPVAVKAVFDDWWGSSSKFDLQSSMDLTSRADFVANCSRLYRNQRFSD